MTKVTANKLIELLRRSGLVEEARLTSFLDKAAAEQGEAALEDQERLAELLVQAGLVTRWQADKLLAGKHKGFRLGKYKLLGQIGKGGMSSVYLAEHEMMKRRVAIKVLPPNRVNDTSYLERFRLEARAVARLDDPNIVRAYDIDNEKDIHYIVMEYVDGQDLHQIVSQNGPLQLRSGGRLHRPGRQWPAARPRDGADPPRHQAGQLPAGQASNGEAARSRPGQALRGRSLADDGQRGERARHGRLPAPEQALNSHEADARSDIYSLGCTLYFLLTGRPPFPEGSISERLLKHQTSKPESIFKTRPDAPPSLVEICETMMAKKPDRTFPVGRRRRRTAHRMALRTRPHARRRADRRF